MGETAEEIRKKVQNRREDERLRFCQGEKPDPLAFPGGIMSGAAGRFAEIYSNHLEPPPQFFFFSYLTCLGSILAGRVRLNSELKISPRLYVLILGESADDRKSTAMTATVDLFEESLTGFPVVHGIGSAEGLQRMLNEKERPSCLLLFDEFRTFVSKCRVESSILLSAVNTLFESTSFSNHTKNHSIDIKNAHVSILAASTVQTFESIMDSHFQGIGFVNRLFIVTGRGHRRFAFPSRIPEAEKYTLRREIGEILFHATEHPVLDIEPAALCRFERWYLGLPQSLYAKRLDTYAMRLMLLLAMNEKAGGVTDEIVSRVIRLCDWQLTVRTFHDPIDADSLLAKVEERIRRILAGGAKAEREIKNAINYRRYGLWIYERAIKNLAGAKEIILHDKKWHLAE